MKTSTVDHKRIIFEFAKKLYYEFINSAKELEEFLRPQNTPLLVMNLRGIKERYREAVSMFEGFKVFYAVKANDHPSVIKTLAEEGAGFEIASLNELENVLNYCKEPSRIISSNPVKPFDLISYAYERGIDIFAVDSFVEVDKIANLAPRSRVYVRISVPNEGSDWPLSGKFGVSKEEAVEILEYARERNLIPYGLTFHVGSQCNNLRNWFIAIKYASETWEAARLKGIKLRMLNLGGGIPVTYLYKSLSIEDIAYYVKGLLRKYMTYVPSELYIEPGRGLVGDKGVIVSRVIGKAKRGDTNWIYIDTGVFNGLAETLGGIRYPIYVDREGELNEWTIGGISCDSMDVISKNVPLPEPEVGDYLYILSAGAYTTVYASHFNGFSPPDVLCLI